MRTRRITRIGIDFFTLLFCISLVSLRSHTLHLLDFHRHLIPRSSLSGSNTCFGLRVRHMAHLSVFVWLSLSVLWPPIHYPYYLKFSIEIFVYRRICSSSGRIGGGSRRHPIFLVRSSSPCHPSLRYIRDWSFRTSLSRKDNSLTCLSAGHRNSLYRIKTHPDCLHSPIAVKCVEHPKSGSTATTFTSLSCNMWSNVHRGMNLGHVGKVRTSGRSHSSSWTIYGSTYGEVAGITTELHISQVLSRFEQLCPPKCQG